MLTFRNSGISKQCRFWLKVKGQRLANPPWQPKPVVLPHFCFHVLLANYCQDVRGSCMDDMTLGWWWLLALSPYLLVKLLFPRGSGTVWLLSPVEVPGQASASSGVSENFANGGVSYCGWRGWRSATVVGGGGWAGGGSNPAFSKVIGSLFGKPWCNFFVLS